MSKFHAFLQRKRWQVTRRTVFNRDDWRCVRCGRAGRLEVDHIIPLRKNPGQDPFDVEGLQSLCRSCHMAKTSRENRKPLTDQMRAWQALVSEMQRDI